MLYGFKRYLEELNHASSTVEVNIKKTQFYRRWLKKHKPKTAAKVSYKEALEFVAFLQKRGVGVDTINHYLTALRHYYNHLSTRHNPFQGLEIRGARHRVMTGLLTKDELTQIYESIQPQTPKEYQYKVMAGLFSFQGVSSTELETINTTDIDTRKATIRMNGTSRINPRLLRLEPVQLLDLVEFITQHRQQLTQKHGILSSQLIVTSKATSAMDKQRSILSNLLRKNNTKYQDLWQLRRSVIVNWLKEDNLRLVQFKAGHRYVSSTEKYKTGNLQELKEAILESHPMG